MKTVRFIPLALLLACGAPAVSSGHFDVESALTAIDPGPSVPLVLDYPGVARAQLIARPDTIAQLEAGAAALRTASGHVDPAALLRDALLLEARVGSECDFACARALTTYFGAQLRMGETARAEVALDPALAPLSSRIAQRHRWATATALRETTDPHLRAEILTGHAITLATLGDHAHARPLLEAALSALADVTTDALAADQTSAQDTLGTREQLARICYALDDASCGDAQLASVTALGATEDALVGITHARDARRTLDATADDASLEGRLARAAALIELNRRDDARTIYEAALTTDPTDARPHTQLALLGLERIALALATPGGLDGVAAHLRAASWLEHRDATFYSLRIILWQFEVMSAMSSAQGHGGTDLERITGDVDAIVEGFGPIDPGTTAAFHAWAHFLELLVGGGAGALEADAAVGARDAIAARAQFPTNVHLARVALVLGVPASGDAARGALANPLPELADVMPAARYLAAIHWNDPTLLPDEVSDTEIGALVSAARARLGGASWPDVVTRYRTLLTSATDADRARLTNGLAVALFEAGQRDEARTTIASAQGDVAALNRFAMSASTPAVSNWLNGLRALRDATTTPHVACLATEMLAHFGAATEAEREQRCTDVQRRAGVDLHADSQFSFDFSRASGLTSAVHFPFTASLLLEIDPTGW